MTRKFPSYVIFPIKSWIHPEFFFFGFCRRSVIFTGAVIVLPDISALASPGERAECRRDSSQQKSSTAGHEGFKGLKALGVRDLSYRLSFIANSVQVLSTILTVESKTEVTYVSNQSQCLPFFSDC